MNGYLMKRDFQHDSAYHQHATVVITSLFKPSSPHKVYIALYFQEIWHWARISSYLPSPGWKCGWSPLSYMTSSPLDRTWHVAESSIWTGTSRLLRETNTELLRGHVTATECSARSLVRTQDYLLTLITWLTIYRSPFCDVSWTHNGTTLCTCICILESLLTQVYLHFPVAVTSA